MITNHARLGMLGEGETVVLFDFDASIRMAGNRKVNCPCHKDGPFFWHMHIPLPFALPTENCVEFPVELGQLSIQFGIHKCMDELRYPRGAGMVVCLIKKELQTPQKQGNVRKTLKSVATFTDKAEYRSYEEAQSGASEKFDQCLEYLRSYLVKLQSFAPFECSWLVYPITTFDLSTLYHTVSAQHKNGKSKEFIDSLPLFFLGKGNSVPQFTMPAPGPQDVIDPMLLTPYELLAEGLFALARGMPRMCVLNSFNAVEILTAGVYEKKRAETLVGSGMAEPEAREVARKERKGAQKFCHDMLHVGMSRAYGRSLHDEDANLYNRFVKVNELRRNVVHAGFSPDKVSAKDAYKTSCEVLAWSASVGGLAVKEYSPTDKGAGLRIKISS